MTVRNSKEFDILLSEALNALGLKTNKILMAHATKTFHQTDLPDGMHIVWKSHWSSLTPQKAFWGPGEKAIAEAERWEQETGDEIFRFNLLFVIPNGSDYQGFVLNIDEKGRQWIRTQSKQLVNGGTYYKPTFKLLKQNTTAIHFTNKEELLRTISTGEAR